MPPRSAVDAVRRGAARSGAARSGATAPPWVAEETQASPAAARSRRRACHPRARTARSAIVRSGSIERETSLLSPEVPDFESIQPRAPGTNLDLFPAELEGIAFRDNRDAVTLTASRVVFGNQFGQAIHSEDLRGR